MYIIYDTATGRPSYGVSGNVAPPRDLPPERDYIEVPNETDYAGMIVAAGELITDPNPPALPPPVKTADQALAEAIATATTLEELKAALLGRSAPGRVAGRSI